MNELSNKCIQKEIKIRKKVDDDTKIVKKHRINVNAEIRYTYHRKF